MTVDIVIVNWNSGQYLSDCLQSIERLDQTGFSIARVVVVDNASTDNSCEARNTALPLTIIRNDKNLGFGAASNQGARGSTSELLLFLNPDIRLRRDSLAAPVAYLDTAPSVAVVGIRLSGDTGATQRTCCRIPTAAMLVAHAAGLDRWFRRTGYVMAEWPHDHNRTVDHVIGAFYLVRRSVFEHAGAFDERFFVYLEDLDLSKRIKDSGFTCTFLAETEAFHAGGGTTRSIKATRLFYSIRSRLQYVAKHHGRITTAAVWLTTLIIEPVARVTMAAVRLSIVEMKEIVSAYRALLRWIVTS